MHIPITSPHSSKPFSGNIKRIVIFSSVVAVGVTRVNDTYTEEEWNDEAVEEVKAKGKEAGGFTKYMASKTLAERGTMTLIQNPRYVYLHRVRASCLGALQ